MKIFMRIVLVVAVAAILTGVVGGIITANDHRQQIESGEFDRSARMEKHKNGMQDSDDCDMMGRRDFEGERGSRRSDGAAGNGRGNDIDRGNGRSNGARRAS